jgi:tetrahydromethanopterin S-methyltransferase subunit G
MTDLQRLGIDWSLEETAQRYLQRFGERVGLDIDAE